jgi:plastocyanin
MRILPPLVLALLAAAPAWAGELAVSLKTPSGQPVVDAVIMVTPQSGKGAVRIGSGYRMAQKDLQFAPFVLVVPLGSEVAFPNLDQVRHHVYSFSAPKPFELKLYSRDETRLVRFDKPGVVAVGCNIHDAMSAYIRVVDTPFAAKTGANGEVVISGLPAGAATITVWHPYLKAARNEAARSATIPASGVTRQALVLDLRKPAARHDHY